MRKTKAKTADENTEVSTDATARPDGECMQYLIKNKCTQLERVLLAKSHDYGEMKPPCILPDMRIDTSILVRMSDKIQRLSNLLAVSRANPEMQYIAKAEVAESIEDTVLDLAGYCILFLIHEGE